jgi:S1-C subfamily serine protease
MHRLIPSFILAMATTLSSFGQIAQQPDPNGPVQKFEGTAAQTTSTFSVNDQWEVRWIGYPGMNVSVVAADNSVVAGASCYRGALYVGKGGTYHLQIDCDTISQPQASSNVSPTPFENTINGGSSNNNAPSPAPVQMQRAPWRVEIVQMSSPAAQVSGAMPNYKLPTGASAPGTTPNPSGAPFGVVTPPPAPTPASPTPPVAPAPGGALTGNQARAVVLIKGDNAEGTGFIIKTPNGLAVITNIHVIANNPNLKITTSTGALVTVLSQKGASDRDLAMLMIKDFGYDYLEMAPDISAVVQTGDEVITPGNSQGGEVMLNTSGKVLGIGPERIEIDNPIYHGNSGGPVFHTKSGKVLGVVTEAMKVDMSNDLDKASFASRNSAISGSMRYFALRLDTVTEWVPIDSRRFLIETTFLDQFQEQSRRLDAFLNSGSGGGGNSQDAKIYLTDERIMKANNDYESEASGGDTAQHIQALREFLFGLQAVADINLDQISEPANFYKFDQERAHDELDYRKALKAELDSIGNNVERLGSLPRSNN